MRKKIIAGNWKMNLTPDQASTLVRETWEEIQGIDGVDVVVCPPFICIPTVREILDEYSINMHLGAQNMHWEESGAYTGEISPVMLKFYGVSHVIIGHSERRQYFGETDQAVNRKVLSALSHDLTPIMCVGESLKERDDGHTKDVVVAQVKRGLFEVMKDVVRRVVIAYEPIWAIGTGKAASAEDAQEVASLIREVLSEIYDEDTSREIRIQYGGSVSPENISDFMSMPDIDGALVGGASIKSESYATLVRLA